MKKRIYIADDDAAILDALELILQAEGFETVVSVDGQSILRALPPLPDLILLDIWMSGSNGMEVCQQIKQHDQLKNIPVLLLSANRDTEAMAREAGANGFLYKPFDIDELLETIQQHV